MLTKFVVHPISVVVVVQNSMVKVATIFFWGNAAMTTLTAEMVMMSAMVI